MVTLLFTDLFPVRLVTRLSPPRLINAAASSPLRLPPTHSLFSEHAEQPTVSGTDGLGGRTTLVRLFVATVSPAQAFASTGLTPAFLPFYPPIMSRDESVTICHPFPQSFGRPLGRHMAADAMNKDANGLANGPSHLLTK